MSNLKLSLEDFFDYDFKLIAINTVLEETKLAFLLNKYLNISLVKNDKVIQSQSKNGVAFFNWYVYEDQEKDVFWNLVQNKKTEVKVSDSLFGEETIAFLLVPELKNVDFILKIEDFDENFDEENILNSITKLFNVSLAYSVNLETLKTLKNLIF